MALGTEGTWRFGFETIGINGFCAIRVGKPPQSGVGAESWLAGMTNALTADEDPYIPGRTYLSVPELSISAIYSTRKVCIVTQLLCHLFTLIP